MKNPLKKTWVISPSPTYKWYILGVKEPTYLLTFDPNKTRPGTSKQVRIPGFLQKQKSLTGWWFQPI